MNEKIKVCFFSRSAYPLFNPDCSATFGGAEVDLYIIAKTLAKDSLFDVYFIVGDFGQAKVEYFENVAVVKSYHFKENKLFQILKLIIKIITVDADVYVQEGASAGTGVIAFICKIFNKRFIFRLASDIDSNMEFIKRSGVVEGFLYTYGLKNASVRISQTVIQKENIYKYHGLTSIIIKNCIEIPSIRNKKENSFVLWVARSEALKQPEIYFKIAQRLSYIKFVMISPKANHNAIDVAKLVEMYKLSNLTFIEHVDFSEIGSYFSRAKIFVNTSEYEGFPNTFVQATTYGTPIVSLNVDPDHFITKYNCGFVCDGDFDRLSDGIQNLYTDKVLFDRMSKNAFLYAKENHDIDSIIPKYAILCKSII